MIKKFLFLFSVIMISACASEYLPEAPEKLIEESKFIDIIVDVHIADAVLSNEQRHDVDLEDTTASYYNFVFNKYQVSRNDFNESMKYYTAQPERFEKMYLEVVKRMEVISQKATEKAKDAKDAKE